MTTPPRAFAVPIDGLPAHWHVQVNQDRMIAFGDNRPDRPRFFRVPHRPGDTIDGRRVVSCVPRELDKLTGDYAVALGLRPRWNGMTASDLVVSILLGRKRVAWLWCVTLE
jgi:hypothetical protein